MQTKNYDAINTRLKTFESCANKGMFLQDGALSLVSHVPSASHAMLL